jgi:16S rRNA (cytosine1402-N4)-methyltransferase
LLPEVLDLLAIRDSGTYVDATLGGGGHSRAILDRLGPEGRLIGIDQDADALARAEEWGAPYGGRFSAVRGNFGNLASALRSPGRACLDGILFDLGVSSHQLDVPGRGFSFRAGGPLDMRMDDRSPTTAEHIIRTWRAEDIEKTIREYGEERFAGRIARAIVRERENIRTTADLAYVVKGAVPKAHGPERIHPATRTFQALRIEVNGEMDALRRGLSTAITLLKPGGRVVVISYHSLEDRIVKTFFREQATGCICPPRLPICMCHHRATVGLVTKKALAPSELEIAGNPRARSARARAAERLPDAPEADTA